MTPRENRRTYGLHYWDLQRQSIGNIIPDIFGLTDEALDDLLPDGWTLINGNERPGTTPEQREEWYNAQMKKARGCVRAVADSILTWYPDATVTVTFNGGCAGTEDAQLLVYSIRITSHGKRCTKKTLEAELDAMAHTG